MHYFLRPDPIGLCYIFIRLKFSKFNFCLFYFILFDEFNFNLLIFKVFLHPIQVVHLSLDHRDHVGGGEVAPVVQLLASFQPHVLPQLSGEVVLHGDVAHVHLGSATKVLSDQFLVRREAAGLLFGSQFTDEFLPTAVLVHLRHVPVPVLDIKAPRLRLPLDPPQLHHLRVLGVPLAPPVGVRGGAAVVMSPGLLVPLVVCGVVVVALDVVVGSC